MNNREVWPHAAQGTLEEVLGRNKTNVFSCNSVEVNVPSTTANLGPGFDVFGLAHDAFVDTIRIEVVSGGEIDVDVVGVDSKYVSSSVEENTAGIVANSMANHLPSGYGLKLRIVKRIPVGKGLGSSGASAAACVFGLNRILGLTLSNNQMIQLAAYGEVASAGSAHADNVAASLLGGFTIIQSYQPFRVIGISPPENLRVVVAIPELSNGEKKTARARAALPKLVPMEKMVSNIGHASSMIVGILTHDLELIGKSMTDLIVEPERAKMIPGYWKVREKALAAGAAGVAISGAGPSMIAIMDEHEIAAVQIAEAMKEGFEEEGIDCRAFVSKPTKGATIVSEE